MPQLGEKTIGIFDSGVGGLSVLREIRALLPAENLIYVADTHYLPYGTKSQEFITARAVAITEFLIAQNAKAIVVACNTATAAAVATLRSRFALPIIGMEPAVKPAVARSQGGRVGVLATNSTLASEKFARLVERFATQADVSVQPCPGLVDLVESGDLSSPAAYDLVTRYVAPLVQQGCDTLVLGCTHFSFLMPLIQHVAGPLVAVIDAGAAVARELKRRLEEQDALHPLITTGNVVFYTSGSLDQMSYMAKRLVDVDASTAALPDVAAHCPTGT